MDESRRQFVAALTAGVTGALAGCGGNGSQTPSEEPTGSPTATGTDGMEPESGSPTATGTDGMEPESGTPVSASQTVTVAPDGAFRFEPESVTVSAGDTVAWEWAASGHNVKPDSTPSGSDWDGTPGAETATFDSGHSYSHTFDTAGEYSYYCAPHQSVGMTGSVTVEQ